MRVSPMFPRTIDGTPMDADLLHECADYLETHIGRERRHAWIAVAHWCAGIEAPRDCDMARDVDTLRLIFGEIVD